MTGYGNLGSRLCNGSALGINRRSVFAACRASGVDIDTIFAAQGNKEFRFDESSSRKSSLGPFQRRSQPRFLLPLSSFSRSIRTCSRLRSSAAYSSRIRARCPSTAGHPNPVLRRLPRKTTESIEVLHTALHSGSQVASFRSPRFDIFLAEHSSAKHTSGFETNVADTQYDDNYIVRLTEPVFIMGYHPTCSFRKVTSS